MIHINSEVYSFKIYVWFRLRPLRRYWPYTMTIALAFVIVAVTVCCCRFNCPRPNRARYCTRYCLALILCTRLSPLFLCDHCIPSIEEDLGTALNLSIVYNHVLRRDIVMTIYMLHYSCPACIHLYASIHVYIVLHHGQKTSCILWIRERRHCNGCASCAHLCPSVCQSVRRQHVTVREED